GALASPTTSSGSGPASISFSTGTSVTRPLLRVGFATVGSLGDDMNQADAAAKARTPAPANSTFRRLSGAASLCETCFRSKLEDCFNGSVLRVEAARDCGGPAA